MQLGNAFYHGDEAVTLAGFLETRPGFVLVSSNMDQKKEYQWVSVRAITAIPLNEDWILAMGFDTAGTSFTFGNYRVNRIGDHHFRISLGGNEIKVVKFVHELQNFLNLIRQ